MVKANTMTIFNTETKILLKLYSFLCFLIKKFVQSKKTISFYTKRCDRSPPFSMPPKLILIAYKEVFIAQT